MSNHNIFAGAFVDRSGHRRKDPEWLQAAADSPECRFVPIWGDKCLAGGEPVRTVLLDRSEVAEFLESQENIAPDSQDIPVSFATCSRIDIP